MRRYGLASAVVAIAIALPHAGFAACVSPRCGAEFTPAVERLRRQIQRACECPRRGDTPREYRRCVKQALRTEARVQRENLPRACLAAVARCEVQSICGHTSRAVVCCSRAANGMLRASIRGNPAACRGLGCERPRHVAEVCGYGTPIRFGPFRGAGQTVVDKGTGLEWENKQPTAASSDLHAPDGRYAWAGSCVRVDPELGVGKPCQPTAAAAAACRAQTPETQWTRGCEPCAAGDGPCMLGGTTTIWDWLVQVNAASFGGHSDWRIPTVARSGEAAELETLFDPIYSSCSEPTASPADPDGPLVGATRPGAYWSATSQEAPYRGAYEVDGRRAPDFQDKRYLAHVRAVRRR